MKIEYIVTVEIDETTVWRKYPNYMFNWGKSLKEFLNFSRRFLPDSERKMRDYGYAVNVSKGRLVD